MWMSFGRLTWPAPLVGDTFDFPKALVKFSWSAPVLLVGGDLVVRRCCLLAFVKLDCFSFTDKSPPPMMLAPVLPNKLFPI